jgi:signal transduction histidine kinase/putative methionine-R-sulfoxide reductase with GAF domain
VPYGIALLSIAVATGLLGAIAYAIGIPRLEVYPLVYVLLVAMLAWRFGRGPAILGIAAFTVAELRFFTPAPALNAGSVNDVSRLITGVVAAGAVIYAVHATRASRTAIEKRKGLLEEISPRIIQSLDAEEILSTVAEQTHRVIDYQHFRLYRWDEGAERLMLVKSVVRASPYAGVDWASVTLGLGEGVTGAAAQTRRAILVHDARRDSRMVYPAGTAPIAESVLCVPMITRDRLFGVLSLARLGVRSLTSEDVRLMEAIGAQAALALANAEQYAEAEQTIHALAVIEALQPTTAMSETEIDERIVGSFVQLSQAEMGSLRVLRPDGRYHMGAVTGHITLDPATPIPPALEANEVAWLSDSRVAAYVADTQTDPRLPEWAREGARLAGVHASVYLPLRARQHFLGFIGLHWRRQRWMRPEQLGRLQLVAAQAAITLDTRRALDQERSRAEALVELERARREFMQIASHELRTPLTVIRGYASLLEDGSLGTLPDKARQAVRTLMDKSSEMRVQVERMLLLARLEDGAAPPQMLLLDLKAVIRDSVARVRPQIELKEGNMSVTLPDEPLPVAGDAERLTTAIDNLLQNAVKFSVGPPSVEVVGDRENGHVRLVIADRGIGIPPAALGRLFEKFFRVDDPRLRNVAGTGIGLYLVRQVVEGHGGRVEVSSEPGQGTAFQISLPAAGAGAPATARP